MVSGRYDMQLAMIDTRSRARAMGVLQSKKRNATSRRSRKRNERGASVLIVFLVITLLTGIGMFAARSAALSSTVAGSSKRLSQTRHVTEYAVMNAAASLARDPQRYVNRMPLYVPVANDPKCVGVAGVPNATCYPLGFEQLEGEAGAPLIEPGDVVAQVPGGLGAISIQADFNIDITDLAPAAPPIAGEALNTNSPVNVKYWALTLTATGQLRPAAALGNVAGNLAASASVQTWRSHVVVGPLSNPPSRPVAP